LLHFIPAKKPPSYPPANHIFDPTDPENPRLPGVSASSALASSVVIHFRAENSSYDVNGVPVTHCDCSHEFRMTSNPRFSSVEVAPYVPFTPKDPYSLKFILQGVIANDSSLVGSSATEFLIEPLPAAQTDKTLWLGDNTTTIDRRSQDWEGLPKLNLRR